MNRTKLFAGSAVLFLLPIVTMAQGAGLASGAGDGGPLGQLLAGILAFTDTVLIPFIIGIGFLLFVWGIFLYFIAGGANDEKKEKGKSLMIYAILGFVLIFVFWGIINLLALTTGLEGGEQEIGGIVPGIPKAGGGI